VELLITFKLFAMKKLIVFLYVVFGALLVATGCFAQDRVINGRVHTFDSIPLINASIKVKSTKQVVKSDTLGNFYAACNYDDVIKVYAKGFYPEKVKLKPNIKLVIANLRLKPGEKNREIAIGYGHILNADKLNAVANLNSDDLDFSQYSNMYELIRGRFTGVQPIIIAALDVRF